MSPRWDEESWAWMSLQTRLVAVAVLALSAVLVGCPAHISRSRAIIREVTLHGGDQINEAELRERIASRETPLFPGNRPRWLRWWRWWWVEPEYYDDNAIDRDRLRIRRYLQARGYYDAEVTEPRTTPLGRGALRLDFNFTPGVATTIADIRLRGCEPGVGHVLSDDVCATIRSRFDLHPGDHFDEDDFTHDRTQVLDFTREAGFPSPRVISRAVVDPAQHLAWVNYTVLPGPRGHFGAIHLLVLPDLTPVTGPTLPNGVPTNIVRSALGITAGELYSRSVLATAQQSLFDLGVFGIARIEESSHPDGAVDLNVQLSSTPLWRLRLGGGFQGDNVNLNAHLLAAYEHRNFLGGLRRLRLEARPELYLPIAFLGSGDATGLRPGISLLAELHQPEIFPHTAGVLSTGFDWGPDPYNPAVVFRELYRAAVGLEHRFSTHLTTGTYLRFSQMTYSPVDSSSNSANDPLYRQEYINQAYAYLDLSITWDRRDSTVRPTRGTLVMATVDASVRGPVSNYTFVRLHADGRAFVRVRDGLVWATRGLAGVVFGDAASSPSGWPVPQELRFYSGGAQSNRGYPYNQVGVLATVPTASPIPVGGTPDDPTRYIALGGTSIWEFSTELRWQPGNLGLVAFFDASNVVGIDPTAYVHPQGVNAGGCNAMSATNALTSTTACPNGGSAPSPLAPADAIRQIFSDAHPSVGLGLRYITPIGPIRLDVGIPLEELGCVSAINQINRQLGGVATGNPSYFVLTSPRCNFLGFTAVPAVFNFAIGEAY